MTLQPTSSRPAREVPRALAYPLLLCIPIVALLGAIKLVQKEALSRVAVLSQHGTPVENWMLFLIAVGIVGSLYLGHCYAHRLYRVPQSVVVTAIVSFVALLVFGAWGLYALVSINMLWYAIARRHRRLPPPE
jgi:hypothetical protein